MKQITTNRIDIRANKTLVYVVISAVVVLSFFVSYFISWEKNGKIASYSFTEDYLKRDIASDLQHQKFSFKINLLAPVTGDDIQTGDPKGPITIIEYGDFTCPLCKDQHKTICSLISKDPMLHAVFRPYPQRFHPNSIKESSYLLCVWKIRKPADIWDRVNLLYQGGSQTGIGRHTNALVDSYENGSPLRKGIEECMEDPKTRKEIEAITSNAQAVGIPGVPSIVILKKDKDPYVFTGVHSEEELYADLYK